MALVHHLRDEPVLGGQKLCVTLEQFKKWEMQSGHSMAVVYVGPAGSEEGQEDSNN